MKTLILIFLATFALTALAQGPPIPPPKSTAQIQEEIWDIPTKEPEFPGGAKALQKFIADKIIYPQMAIDNGDQGVVYVQMIIEPDGRITNAHILRGVSIDIDVEAMRVVKGMPKWIPAEVDGKRVRVRYNLPINFRLD